MTTKKLLEIIAALREHAVDLKNVSTGTVIVGTGYSKDDPGMVIRKKYIQTLEANLLLISGQLETLIPDQPIEAIGE